MEATFYVFLIHLGSSYKTTFRLYMTQEIEITMGGKIVKDTQKKNMCRRYLNSRYFLWQFVNLYPDFTVFIVGLGKAGKEGRTTHTQAELLRYIMHMGTKDCLADLFMVCWAAKGSYILQTYTDKTETEGKLYMAVAKERICDYSIAFHEKFHFIKLVE
jgi:hypothetical protein